MLRDDLPNRAPKMLCGIIRTNKITNKKRIQFCKNKNKNKKQANIRDMAGTKVDKSQFVYMSKDVPNHESTITNRIRKQQLKLLFPNQNSDKRV